MGEVLCVTSMIKGKGNDEGEEEEEEEEGVHLQRTHIISYCTVLYCIILL